MKKSITYSRFLILCHYPIYCSSPGLALLRRKLLCRVSTSYGCDFLGVLNLYHSPENPGPRVTAFSSSILLLRKPVTD